MKPRSSADGFPSHVSLVMRLTVDRVSATWKHGANRYCVSGRRGPLELGDVSGLHVDRNLADAYMAQLPQAFEAHLLPTMCAEVIDAALRHRGGGDHDYEHSVRLDLTGDR